MIYWKRVVTLYGGRTDNVSFLAGTDSSYDTFYGNDSLLTDDLSPDNVVLSGGSNFLLDDTVVTNII